MQRAINKHKVMLNIISYQEIANQNCNKMTLQPISIIIIKSKTQICNGKDVEKLEQAYTSGKNIK